MPGVNYVIYGCSSVTATQKYHYPGSFTIKGALKQNTEASLYTLYWRFKEISFTLYTYVVAKILRNGAKVIQKLHEEFGQLLTSSGKSKKLKFDGLLLSKKYIPSAKTYTEDLSNITFKYLCENSPNSLCHF